MSDRALKLAVWVPEPTKFKGVDAYRVRMEVTDAVVVSPHVFVHKREPVNPYALTYQDEFSYVAGPSQIVTYPEVVPDLEKSPYFRKSVVDVILPTVQIANRFIETVKQELACLIETYDLLDALELVSEEWIGTAPEESESSESMS